MKNNLQPLEWHTEHRIVKDLIPYEFNPRAVSEEKRQKLIDSIKKFNFVEIPVINLDNILIAGHQRILAMVFLDRETETVDVRVPNRQLTELELKEYNLRSNISIGDWVDDMLKEHFDDIDFDAIGLGIDEGLLEMLDEEKQLTQFEEKFNKIPNEPVYPIVAKYNEKYSAIIIVAKNITDLTFLQTVLDLSNEASYKSERIGQTHVIDAKKFQELWEKK